MKPLPESKDAYVDGLRIDHDFHQHPLSALTDMEQLPQTLSLTGPAAPWPAFMAGHEQPWLQRASQQVAEVLAAIYAFAHHPDIVRQLLQALSAQAETLRTRLQWSPDSPAAQPPSDAQWMLRLLVRERSMVHLRHLQSGQRRQLLRGLQQLQQTSLHSHPLLAEIHLALQEQLLQQACEVMLPTLHMALQSARSHTLTTPLADQHYLLLRHQAKDTLQATGLDGLAFPQQLDTLPPLLVESVITRFIDTEVIARDNAQPLQDLHTFFQRLSLSHLAGIFALRETHSSHPWFAWAGHQPYLLAESAFSQQVQACKDRLQQLANSLTEQPLTSQPTSQWQRLVKKLLLTMRHANRLQSFAQQHLPSLATALDPARQSLCHFLESTLDGEHQQVRALDRRSLRLLRQLAKALKCRPVEHAMEQFIGIEAAQAIYVPLLQRGIHLALDGDVHGLLQAINAAHALSKQALRLLLKQRIYVRQSAILKDIYGPVIHALDNVHVQTLHAVLHDSATMQNLDHMAQAGQQLIGTRGLLDTHDSHKGQACLDRAEEIALLQQCTSHTLRVRNLPSIGLSPALRQQLQQWSAHDTLVQALRLQTRGGQPPSYATHHVEASAALQALWNQHLAQVLPMQKPAPQPLRPPVALAREGLADPAFVKELAQMVHVHGYTYADSEGHSQPLVATPSTRLKQTQAAYDTLRALGCTAAAANAAMQCATPVVFACVPQFWPSPANPLANAQHAHPQPMLPHATRHYHFTPAPEQGLYVRLEYGTYAFMYAQDLNAQGHLGAVYEVDPCHSHFHLCSKLHIDAQGVISIHTVLHITAQMQDLPAPSTEGAAPAH